MVDLNKGATVGLVKALSDDIRTLPDGTKAASAGEAVRAQVNDLRDAIPAIDDGLDTAGAAADAKATGDVVNDLKSALSVNNHIDFELTLGKSVDATGAVASNTYMAVTQRIACDGGDIVKRLIPNTDSNGKHLALYVAEYAGISFVKRTEMIAVNSTLTLGSTTDSIILSFGRYSSSGTAITQADADTYFAVDVYRRSIAQANFDDYIANKAFISRGNVIDIGYASFSQCSAPGVYTFSTANISSINDVPPGLNTGGILLTYVAGASVYQEIHSTYFEYIRYRTSGTWLDKKRFIRVAYVSGAGNDGSIEGVDVFIKRSIDGKGVRYSMGHCVDATANANVWRLMYIYSLAAHQVGGTVMTRRGEFECALHLSGRPDFSGGYVHGDEIDQAVTFIGDGNVMTAPEVSGFYTNFRIVRNSILYDPNDNATPIANHGVEYIFTADGLTVKQSVKWLVDASLTSCYLAMLPILKAFSTYRYDDTCFTVAKNDQSGYSITIPDASIVTEYIDTISTTMEIEKYPDGLTGGDCALITDNGGENYNKAYFVVCTSGSITAGTLWKSVTKYKIE